MVVPSLLSRASARARGNDRSCGVYELTNLRNNNRSRHALLSRDIAATGRAGGGGVWGLREGRFNRQPLNGNCRNPVPSRTQLRIRGISTRSRLIQSLLLDELMGYVHARNHLWYMLPNDVLAHFRLPSAVIPIRSDPESGDRAFQACSLCAFPRLLLSRMDKKKRK